MKIWIRVAISVLFSLFTNDAWAQPGSLLDAFCGEYVASPGTALLQPARWAHLAEKLRTTSPSDTEEVPEPALRDCRSLFSADFEVAEFILRAKSIIEATQNSAIERQTSQLGEALLDVSISELGDLRLMILHIFWRNVLASSEQF